MTRPQRPRTTMTPAALERASYEWERLPWPAKRAAVAALRKQHQELLALSPALAASRAEVEREQLALVAARAALSAGWERFAQERADLQRERADIDAARSLLLPEHMVARSLIDAELRLQALPADADAAEHRAELALANPVASSTRRLRVAS